MRALLTDDEMTKLRDCPDEQSWNALCSEIKAARGGAYPEDWGSRVLFGGLMAQKQREFAAGPKVPEFMLPGAAQFHLDAPERNEAAIKRLNATVQAKYAEAACTCYEEPHQVHCRAALAAEMKKHWEAIKEIEPRLRGLSEYYGLAGSVLEVAKRLLEHSRWQNDSSAIERLAACIAASEEAGWVVHWFEVE